MLELSLPTLLLLSLPCGALAQQWTADTLIPPATYAVQGAPFVALVEEIRTPAHSGQGSIHRFVRVLRDSQGRERYEDLAEAPSPSCTAPPPSIEIDPALAVTKIRILDVVGHRFLHLDPRNSTATSCPMESTSPPISVPASRLSDPAAPVPQVTEESSKPSAECEPVEGAASSGAATEPGMQPGTQRIAGLEATLTRTTREVSTGQAPNAQQIQVVDEVWTSPLYRMPLMHVIDDPRYGHTVLRVVRFEAREPAASLFEVPPGYTVQTQENGACHAAPSSDAKR